MPEPSSVRGRSGVEVRCAEDHDPHPMNFRYSDLTFACPVCGARTTEYSVINALPPEYRTGMGRMLAHDFLDARPYAQLANDRVAVYFERPSHD